MMNLNHENGNRTVEKRPIKPLTTRQERKLVDYLDEAFLQLTRNFKKRTEASSTLKTLPTYLEAVRQILAIVLQIPPVDPSTSLRIAYMLRLTGDALSSIPGYTLGSDETTTRDTLQDLVDFLDDLDQAWIAVLQNQIWDPESAEGVDLVLPAEIEGLSSSPETNGHPVARTLKSTPPSQTDVTRLRSLLFAGQSSLEEWLAHERGSGGEEEPQDVSSMLSRMGLLDDFDSLFVRTLNFLGGFAGNVARNTVDPLDEAVMEDTSCA
ncbi:hypothetical protein JR316_0002992 [Psilocybe cubensis]|uniref:Uncharacterized protein n=2 Tax=Psilocybe cubensis TaxID=181762 RepID=A0ACB8H737_PSICU|nr:hypothetical protein JR316_0002992 [Psilocybe cubensis]KAH9483524.1 hypothetical protein JR316_0002992 [Psilocybe cubensis]